MKLSILAFALIAGNVFAWDLTYYASTVEFVKATELFPSSGGPSGAPTSSQPVSAVSSSSAGTTPVSSGASSSGTPSSTFSGYFNSSLTVPSASLSTALVSSTADLSEFASEILAEHNAKRALHGSPALTWNLDLAAFAENYVTNGYNACAGSLEHSATYYDQSTGYGENLALGYTYTGAVDAWYNEIANYNWTDPENGSSGEIGHFTQVVWNTTTELGCAYKYCGAVWSNYIVCEYYPEGNIVGEYAEHVPPLLSSS